MRRKKFHRLDLSFSHSFSFSGPDSCLFDVSKSLKVSHKVLKVLKGLLCNLGYKQIIGEGMK